MGFTCVLKEHNKRNLKLDLLKGNIRKPICSVQARDKAFLTAFEKRAKKTIRDFKLLAKKDRILVAVSGGKDSTAMLYLLHKLGYHVEAITVDSKIGCYSQENLANLQQFCKKIGVLLHTVSFRETYGGSLCYFKDILREKGINLSSCTICGVLRRHILNVSAKKIGADKIVTGHNMDDETQAILLNLFKGYLDRCAQIGPLVGSHNKFVPRAKPFYLTPERDIITYTKILKLPVSYGSCPCAEGSMRHQLRKDITIYIQKHPDALPRLMQNFLALSPALKKMANHQQMSSHMSSCGLCGEPARKKICRSCEIVKSWQPTS